MFNGDDGDKLETIWSNMDVSLYENVRSDFKKFPTWLFWLIFVSPILAFVCLGIFEIWLIYFE